MRPIRYELLARASGSQARRGRLHTRHGVVETPVFMPVGTLASVKSLDPRDLIALGARICLANAYHLMLRPGAELVRELGGLHRFSGYEGAILTDSGGFQIYSLAELREITDAGATFRSHVDGTLHELSPERLVKVQELLGPDIAMVLDECPPANAARDAVERAVTRTTLWAERCLRAREREEVAWFGIAQGALFEDLRQRHAERIGGMDFDGFAIGGVSVGESPDDIARIVKLAAPLLPEDKPRYLMGVGTPADLVRGVDAGVDMFDCVLPTRNARNGYLFTSTGKLIIKNSEHRSSDAPVDASCSCYTCTTFSRGFLRHLFVAKEMSYSRLATIHNLAFYLGLMQRIRAALDAGTFSAATFLAEAADLQGGTASEGSAE
jgi:queuine tRNA-ribosyltransferase